MSPEMAFTALCILLFVAWVACVVIDERGRGK